MQFGTNICKQQLNYAYWLYKYILYNCVAVCPYMRTTRDIHTEAIPSKSPLNYLSHTNTFSDLTFTVQRLVWSDVLPIRILVVRNAASFHFSYLCDFFPFFLRYEAVYCLISSLSNLINGLRIILQIHIFVNCIIRKKKKKKRMELQLKWYLHCAYVINCQHSPEQNENYIVDNWRWNVSVISEINSAW